MITTELIFWTQIVSIVGYVAAAFYLYRLLVEQKDSTVQLQRENIAYLKDQLADARAQSPDVLAQSLRSRVTLFEEELKRLEQDKSSTQDEVAEKEAELKRARLDAEELTKQVIHARQLLQDFVCPHCGALLAEKAYDSESVEYRGREIDIDHEYVAFECGYSIVDGQVRSPCKNTKLVLPRERRDA